jgi:hypothetical protein
MAVINLRNVVALGVLEDGVYPSVYNGQTGEYIGTVDGEGAGVKTVPTLYMYYRKNGHLYLYRTKERIEIDLTNVTAYDNSALFKLTEKSDISSAKITEFESRNIDVGHYEYKVPWVKSTQQYLYILVPIVRSIHTITVQGIISNQIFTLTGIYVHEGKSWWIYRTNVKTNFDFNDAVNEILDVQVYVRELTAEDLNPIEQLTKLLFEHINNKFNPHEVTKEQVGLGNVDNTADIDKPVSRPQKEYIDALENRVKGWFKQLNVWINNHVAEVNKKFQDVWAAINKKLDKEDYENDKDNFNAHIRNYDNPHRVTAAQVGLPTAASDIEKLKQKAQELQGLLINKQDKTSEELVTDNKRIVDAINEIYGIVVEHNNHVRSNSINQIEVTSEIPTTFEDGTLWIRIPRNEEDYITIKIEAVPVDSTIRMINSEGKESAGIGSASLECLIQSRLHYIVEKENYITKDVYVDVGVEDTTINVVLTPKTKKTLTVNATPNNALIIFIDKPSNVVIAQGTGTLTYETYDPRDILIQVGASGYETYEERITLDENIIRDITLTALPVEQGAVSLTVVDSETKAKIAAYVYDKDTGGILGQVTKDTPLQLTGDINTSQILRFVASGYDDHEQLVTYTNPVNNITIELTKTVVPDGSLYAKALKTNGELISTATFRYHTGDNNWLPLSNRGDGTSNIVLASDGTRIYFEVSANGYITNTGSGIIVSGQSNSVDVILEIVPPEPSYDWFIFAVNADGGQPVETLTKAELFVDNVWVEQEIRTVIASKGFNVNGKKGDVVKVRFTATGYVTTTQDVILTSESEESRIIPVGMELLPPEPENVNVTIRVKDDSGNYLTATIKEISVTGDTVGTSTPEEPLVITKNKGSVITYYALPLSSDWYKIGYEEVVFDTNKTVEILCLRKNNGLIKVRTRDALTGCMIINTIYDETGKNIGNCDSSENGYVSEANPIGFERNYKTLGDTRYEATEPIMFIAAKPSEAVVNYIDLHPKEGQDYIALKFIDSVTKAPITTGISCWFTSTVKTIVTDYQGIAHISGTYDSKVVILVRRNGYVEYNQTYDSLANHSVTTIELVPEPVFENDCIDYMQIEGDGIEHPIFRVGNVESN